MNTLDQCVKKLSLNSWQANLPSEQQAEATRALEEGALLLLPELNFQLEDAERYLISPDFSDKKAKNISYHSQTETLKGAQGNAVDLERMQRMLARFARQARGLIENVLPHYSAKLQWGRTSYRPIEITDRKISYRKDDKRLHVDAFPASPNQGRRILRVFCNINPAGQPRVWRIGEPFEKVARRFLPHIPKPLPGSSRWLYYLKITKSLRTEYDHIMLQMHDRMKKDNHYQQNVAYTELALPAGASWIVQTDHVSHAALSGQHLLEQTFYLPVTAMQAQEHSPLRILERLAERTLVLA
ncbi:MAG: Kdo hydroxylase family protein [Gammaproteobacteria bacterium]